jgi:hypothetical protein
MIKEITDLNHLPDLSFISIAPFKNPFQTSLALSVLTRSLRTVIDPIISCLEYHYNSRFFFLHFPQVKTHIFSYYPNHPDHHTELTFFHGRSTRYVGRPKSNDSYRQIPVPPSLRKFALALRDTDKKFIWEVGKQEAL